MPVYNEEATVARAIRRLLDTIYPCEVELVVVDDGSTDTTPLLLEGISDPRMRVHRHLSNFGKGAAVRSGVRLATGTHALVFDADLEYAPTDIPAMLAPVIAGRCSYVYGARQFGNHTIYPSFWFALGNKVTTFAANLLFDAFLTDLHTCLKLVPLDELRAMSLRERGFGLDTELTASLLKRGVRPFEVPVSYYGRSHAEGKKIQWQDGVECLRILLRVRLRGDGDDVVVPLPATAVPPTRAMVAMPSQPTRGRASSADTSDLDFTGVVGGGVLRSSRP
ncbi:glycosyltransferase family 2 protein [Frankia sp. AiPa1]|nr:glycosyltransferase family 2 protein [Frankia sp. AiPa1]